MERSDNSGVPLSTFFAILTDEFEFESSLELVLEELEKLLLRVRYVTNESRFLT